MLLRSKIVLKSRLSRETLDAMRAYPTQFLAGRYTLEHFDGTFSIHLYRRDDLRLLRERFPSWIANVQDVC
jgi:hypothetical protein